MLFQWSAHGTWTVLIKQNFKLNLKKLDPPFHLVNAVACSLEIYWMHWGMGLSLLERQRN